MTSRGWAALLLVVAACAHKPAAAPQQKAAAEGSSKSLYDRLGGEPALRAVVDAFVGNLAADDRINYYFAMSDLTHLKAELVEQLCEVAGGPCHYAGQPMKAVHARLPIADAQFDALVEDLVKTLDAFKVPARERSELLTPLAGLRDSVVTVR